MEPETITSTATLLGAAGTFLAVIGAGIWKLIARADRKREQREERLIENLREQLASKNRVIRWHEQVETIKDGVIRAYREQLIRNGIEPDPSDLPPLPPREDGTP